MMQCPVCGAWLTPVIDMWGYPTGNMVCPRWDQYHTQQTGYVTPQVYDPFLPYRTNF